MVAYNNKTVANIKPELILYDFLSYKRCPLSITVNMRRAPNKTCDTHLYHQETNCPTIQGNWPYKIIAFHLEKSSASTEMKKISDSFAKISSPHKSPHLLVGDTNLYQSHYITTDQPNMDANGIFFPSYMRELMFQNKKGTTLRQNGEKTDNIIDRAWFNQSLVHAKGAI